jgi:phosphatidylglycerophosphatase A
VVLDEMMGYWITVAIFPFSYRLAFLGFILFRFFDIFKPFPIKNFEKFKGGLGIMADDFMAGIYAWLILAILFLQYHYTGVKIL